MKKYNYLNIGFFLYRIVSTSTLFSLKVTRIYAYDSYMRIMINKPKKLVYGQCQECGVDATDSNGVWGLEFFDELGLQSLKTLSFIYNHHSFELHEF
ncbi:hypothetical protein H8356DRAFT_1424578 [Neocallimastix lanati (nom. inval.)]|nr:hypothetical protein H8356DRAFT_1424578 [Neocallimastix sp. JGI-2020a]